MKLSVKNFVSNGINRSSVRGVLHLADSRTSVSTFTVKFTVKSFCYPLKQRV